MCRHCDVCSYPPFVISALAMGQTVSSLPHLGTAGSTPDAVLPSCGCVFYLEYRTMSSAFFSGRAPCLAILLRPTSGIVIVPHRLTARTTPQTDTQRDDLCRLSRILRHLICEPILSPSSLSGTLMV